MIIKPMPEAGKISEAGFYDIPIEIYHSDICDGPFHVMAKRGKSRAGRLLDGVEHNGMPETRND